MLNATIPQRALLLAGKQIGPHGLPITIPNELRTSSVTSGLARRRRQAHVHRPSDRLAQVWAIRLLPAPVVDPLQPGHWDDHMQPLALVFQFFPRRGLLLNVRLMCMSRI
jgi:hypothetical protein